MKILRCQTLVEYSDESDVEVYLGIDEDYFVEIPDEDTVFRVETLEQLHEILTSLDLEGYNIPQSTFHDIELQLEKEYMNFSDNLNDTN